MICALTIAPIFTLGVSAAVPYDNMIALYNMEDAIKDEISGGSGTLWNGASFADDGDRGGKVLVLNNDSVVAPGEGEGYDKEGQWAELAAPHIPDSDQMTISIWFKVKETRTWARAIDIGDAKAQVALAGGESATVGPDRFINISPTNGSYTIGTFNVNDSGEGIANNRDRVFADQVNDNEWIHAVLVVNADSGNPNVLYINGKAFQSTHGGENDDPEAAEFSPKEILAAPDGVRNVFLGRSAYENNGDQIFNGWIDDVAIFNVALTADQVAELNKVDFKAGNPAAVVEVAVSNDEPVPFTPVESADVVAAPSNDEPVAFTPVAVPQTSDATWIVFLMMAVALVSGGCIYKKSR